MAPPSLDYEYNYTYQIDLKIYIPYCIVNISAPLPAIKQYVYLI